MIAVPIVLLLLLGPELPPDVELPPAFDSLALAQGGSHDSKAQLVDALERLLRTGEPRHVSHDDGQELDVALKAALAAGSDADLEWLATRAAAPIVPTILRPLSSRRTPGALSLRTERVLTLPWNVEYVADVDARMDGGRWQRILRVKSGVSEHRSLDKLLPAAAAMTPGFHTLALRARIRYGELPPGMPRRETRDLVTVHYGVWGSARTAADPVRPFFDAAASVSAATLDSNLSDVPFSSWLKQLPHNDNERMAMDWRTEWCGRHESMSDEGLVSGDVCVVARTGGPGSPWAEAWLKVGALGSDDGHEPRWVRKPAALVAAYVLEGTVRVRVPLSAVPDYLSRPVDQWPSARLVVNTAGISVMSPTIAPGVPTTVRILVANMGDADATGVTINVLAASEENLPSTLRTFVRTIRAGGSVEIEMPVVFPARYGIVHVLIAPGHDDIGPKFDSARENYAALAVINPRAAPAEFLQRVRRLCVQHGRAAEFCAP